MVKARRKVLIRTVERFNTFQASDCIKVPPVPLAKTGYKVKPRVSIGGLHKNDMDSERGEIWDH